MHVDEKASASAGTPTEPVSEPLPPLAPDAGQPGEEEDDSPDAIFFRAVSEIPTQPLAKLREQKRAARHFTLVVLLFMFSLLAGSIIAILMYPTVTIELVPLSRHAVFTTQLEIPTRTLPPVTLSKSFTATTTGHGHQNARNAIGTVTFYNGLFTTQTIPIGTVFTGNDGVKVSTEESVTIPAATPPQFAEATITAQAITEGAAGNIQAGDIHTTVYNGILVKNTSSFHEGRDARDFQAVAKSDLDSLTSKLQQILTEQIPQAFVLRPGEALQPTHCIFKATQNHHRGEEAREVTVKAFQTCQGIAYNQDELNQKATAVFTTTRPGTNYELEGDVQVNVTSVFPFAVSLRGLWVYHVSQDFEQFLAQQIAGDTPAQAKSYLLRTGIITQATIPQQLPKDPGYIHFQILIGL